MQSTTQPKISKPLQYAYIAAFGGMLLGLAGWSLKSFPGFSAAADTPLLNGKLAHAFEARYDKEFPIKRLGTNLWAALDYTLFHEGRPGVVIGKDGWLFTDEEFKPAPTEQQLEDNWALVRGVQQELERRGVKLVLAIIPAKARLYPEHIGREQPAALHASLYQRLPAPRPPGRHGRARPAGHPGPGQGQRPGVPAHRHPLDAAGRRGRGPAPGRRASARARLPTCRPRPSSPGPAKNARTRATCSPSCRWTRCSPNCCRVRRPAGTAPDPPGRRRHGGSPAGAATSSATAPSRGWPWSAPATAPTRAGTSRAR